MAICYSLDEVAVIFFKMISASQRVTAEVMRVEAYTYAYPGNCTINCNAVVAMRSSVVD